jgi:hypothetical protein
MPVINVLLVLAIANFPLAILGTIMMAMLSWFLIEQPALSLNRRLLKSIKMGKDSAAKTIGGLKYEVQHLSCKVCPCRNRPLTSSFSLRTELLLPP